MSPSRTPRYALSDVTQQQNMTAPVLTNSATTGFDHSSVLVDETEAFALEPIDVTAIGEYFCFSKRIGYVSAKSSSGLE